MKTILFILLPFFAVSQSPETASEIKLLQYEDYFEDAGQDSAEYPIFFVDVSLPHRPFTWIVDDCIHLIDLLEYQTECYNDSTAIYEHFDDGHPYVRCPGYVLEMIGMDGVRYVPCEMAEHKRFVEYSHREPTFTGFIEWLKRKEQ